MDPDRKSTTSSFYGGRKSSFDALHAIDPQSPTTPQFGQSPGGDHDAASSFFNPDRNSRASADMLNGGQPNSAGYNSLSFMHTGREEPLRGGQDEEEPAGSAWDVFADFNNAGPRYSEAFGPKDTGYQKVPQPILKPDDTEPRAGHVELVTVPGFGPEWQRDEMREMTKAGKRERKAESRRQKWKAWSRDERGLCGTWFKRRFLVFFIFGLFVLIGIILAFTIPRVPGVNINQNDPLIPATGSYNASIPSEFSRYPANFSFPAYSPLQIDTTGNYLPLTFNHISAQIFDLGSDRLIGTGYMGHKTLPAKAFPVILMPLNFSYVADNYTDQTWTDWYNGCKNVALYPNGTRPAVRFILSLELDIAGLLSPKSASVQVSNANCPIELPQNSV